MSNRGSTVAATDAEAKAKICAQCQVNEAIENVRGREMCLVCFRRYIETKCVKRMDAFRTRNSNPGQQRLLLLPLSLGLSSVALLQLLQGQLDRQVSKSGRTGFQLHVIHVDTSSVDGDDRSAPAFERIKDSFPNHAYSKIPLSDAMDVPDLEDALRQNDVATPSSQENTDSTPEERLSRFLSTLPSTTARVDAMQILRKKLIVSAAKSLSCEAILWGDTTTRLAEKTLSETAKGRGFGLAWAISDGPSPFGLDFYYPMRDLLKKELVAYTAIGDVGIKDLIVPETPVSTVVNAKNSSIDELMRGYFEGVESSYPSIVANVVRTTGRLQVPAQTATTTTTTTTTTEERGVAVKAAASGRENIRCGLCGLPIISAGGEDGLKVPGMERHGIQFCHGCARSFPLSSA